MIVGRALRSVYCCNVGTSAISCVGECGLRGTATPPAIIILTTACGPDISSAVMSCPCGCVLGSARPSGNIVRSTARVPGGSSNVILCCDGFAQFAGSAPAIMSTQNVRGKIIVSTGILPKAHSIAILCGGNGGTIQFGYVVVIIRAYTAEVPDVSSIVIFSVPAIYSSGTSS